MRLLPQIALFHVQNEGLEINAKILETWPNRLNLKRHKERILNFAEKAAACITICALRAEEYAGSLNDRP
jgi:hypothetical protein